MNSRIRRLRESHIPPHAVAVMSLHMMAFDRAEICRITGYREDRVLSILDVIAKTQDQDVQAVLRNGFTTAHQVPLKEAVECPSCRARLTAVPCLPCRLASRGDIVSPAFDGEEATLQEPKVTEDNSRWWRPTKCRPGTSGKIAELARRVEKSLPLYHPDDEKLPMHHLDGGLSPRSK